jgi:hypothetical protein
MRLKQITLEEILSRMPEEYKLAHKESHHHRDAILASTLVSCYYCCKTYPPSKIVEWTDNGQTAICPCWVDAVLPGARPLAFLRGMYKTWFE